MSPSRDLLFRAVPAEKANVTALYQVPGTGKHRLCDTTKAKLIRSTPETFKGLGLSQRSAFCPKKALLAGMVYTHSPLHGRLIERLISHMILDRTPSKP